MIHIIIVRLLSGDHHPDTFHTMNNLANNFRCQYKYCEAEELFTVCLDRMRTTLGRLMIMGTCNNEGDGDNDNNDDDGDLK
jgi:hypothetical protein